MEQTQEILTFLLTTMQDTKTFVLSQAPDLAQQIVAYTIGSGFLGLMAALGMAILAYLCFRLAAEDTTDDYGVAALLVVFALLLFGGSGIIAVVSGNQIIKAYTAPKLVIIEKATRLLQDP